MSNLAVTDFIDPYSRIARLYPALLTAAPTLCSILTLAPGMLPGTYTTLLFSLFTACGVPYAISSYARTAGKRAEADLLKSWGGWPAVHLLRHNSQLDSFTRKRYHTFLEKNVKGLKFPTAAQENETATASDAACLAATNWLREQSRGKAFSLLLKENAQYGFRRNLLGLRSLGIALSAINVAACLLVISAVALGPIRHLDAVAAFIDAFKFSLPGLVAAFIVNCVALLIWFKLVSASWVREAADQYAARLLACCDVLAQSSNSAKQTASPRVRQL